MSIFRPRVIHGPDGSPYLYRWTIFRCPYFAVFLHRFVRGDSDLCLHDHPWSFVSLILRGGYYEVTDQPTEESRHMIYMNPLDRWGGTQGYETWYGPGRVLRRPATYRHRVRLRPAGDGTSPTEAWTLVIRGSYVRPWGFWTRKGFMPWREFEDHPRRGALCNDVRPPDQQLSPSGAVSADGEGAQ